MIKLAIIGSGDLGQLIAHHAKLTGNFEVVGFFDDYLMTGSLKGAFPILGKVNDVERSFINGDFDQIIVAVGYKHFQTRALIFDRWKNKIPFATLIHPSAVIDPTCQIGEGSVILSGCVLDCHVEIQDNVLLNTGVMIAHHSMIGRHSFLAPRVSIAGFVKTGPTNFIGIGATIIDNIHTAEHVIVGGGALVHKNIGSSGIYVGVPARKIK